MLKHFVPVTWAHWTNIYEVNLRQYTEAGTFRAFSGELPRLKEMGVHTIWLMPVTPISEKNRKGTLGSYYACSDYTSINPEFGNPEDFRDLVNRAHELGFKLIIDWVANHTGWDHRWTREHPGYYKTDPATGDFQVASGMEDIIELDFSNPGLRKAMIDAMAFWVREYDIDGFRCDLAFWVQLDFWLEARPVLDAVKPLLWLGEFDELDHPQYSEAFDASYTWTWMHRTEEFYKGKAGLEDLKRILNRYDDLGDRSMRAWFTSNHDENSWNGTEFEKYGDMAALLAVFSCTWNGIPLLYSGQEVPNTKRLAFFERDPIVWTGHNRLHGFYRALLGLRNNHPALHGGDPAVRTFRVKTSEPEKVFAFRRQSGTREVLVLLNFSSEKIDRVVTGDSDIGGRFTDLFSGTEQDFTTEKFVELDAWGYRVFSR
ncbi:MAG: alpha-amylase family glycosyl hydrolase [Chitinophagaceae bacterium]